MKYFLIFLSLSISLCIKLELLEVFHKSIDWQANYQPTYEKQMKKMERQIQIMKEQRRAKNQQCDRIQRGLDFIVNEKEKNEKFTSWLTSRIEQNQNRVEKLNQIKCQSSSSFYETMNEQNRVNKLNQFFVSWISRDQKLLQLQDTQTFIQEMQVENEYQDALLILSEQIRSCKLSPFKQQTIDRSESSRRDFEQNIFALEKLMTQNNDQLELNEVRVQDKITKFIQQLDKETEQLQIHYESIMKIINKSPVETTSKQRLDQCQKDVLSIDKLIEATQEAIKRIQTCAPSEGLAYKQKRILSQIAKEYSSGVAKFEQK
ncbi:unnamed protein product (macronuclear) [Paramecium tetraurelia]|uniref:Uncharacterized protein n=1 Tax=Paramecium tetraurelia TaxID=5888 RepID=A0BLS4_PARTE|nr:uncharacterized protein GSPATT00030125001 [Paramecium tetraurelia]CAK59491.1 unnamed protein product [Paramecium tetraurelia]|eukprot:XP_001426889.1 hypothetical protein (macronuclear) [Paramecium tetraurelia strain d4-2]